MNKISRAFVATLLLVATPALAATEDVLPVSTDEISTYRGAGEWTVRANETRGTCFISRSDDEGYLVQMGFTKNSQYGYVGIFKKGADVGEKDEAVAIAINGNLYIGSVKKLVHGASGGYQGGYVVTNDRQLRLDLESQNEMVIFPESPYTVTVNLKDVRNAIFEARKCTRELQSS